MEELRLADLKLMANAIEKIHVQLTVLRGHVESTGCLNSLRDFNCIELGIAKQLRALRKNFGIPYGASDG